MTLEVVVVVFFLITFFTFCCSLQHGIRKIGRWSPDDTADWSGSALTFFVRSTTSLNATIFIDFKTCLNCNYFIDYSINCKSVSTFNVVNSMNEIALTVTNSLRGSVYQILITKKTEPSTGALMVSDIRLKDAEVISGRHADICHEAHKRKMIFVGDSISVGFGVDGQNPCAFTSDTENVLHAYSSISATHASSDYHVIAWSGRGVVRNYGESENTSKSLTVPELYNRTLATSNDSSLYWDPNNYQV